MTRKEQTATDAGLYYMYMYYMSELSEYYAFLHTGTAANIFDFTQASQKKKALGIPTYIFLLLYILHINDINNEVRFTEVVVTVDLHAPVVPHPHSVKERVELV